MRRRALLLTLTVLLASGCGERHAQKSAPPRHQPWTSSAEPSPPGSGGRWSPADEQQLRESQR